MATIQPPPTWAEVVDEANKSFSPIWLKWFVDLASTINGTGGGGGSVAHNLLSGLQGGTSSEYYHLSQAQYTIFSFFKGQIPLRKIADQSVTASTTLVDDSDLSFTLNVSEEWMGMFVVDTGAALSTTGMKVALTVPAGAVMDLKISVNCDTIAATGGYVKRTTTSGTALDFTTANLPTASEGLVMGMFWILNSTNVGQAHLQFAQSTNSGTALTFRKGSYMIATRVA